MKINNYPDGTSYVILDKYDINYKEEWKVFKTNTYEDLHHLEQFVDVCNNEGFIPKIIIPNLLDAQADRRFYPNHSSGLKIVCKRLNSMNAKFKIFHPHNPEVVEALIDTVELIDSTQFIKGVLKKLHKVHTDKGIRDPKTIYNFTKLEDQLVLMSADAGGFKPLIKLCDNLQWKGETYSAAKYRKSSILDKSTDLVQQIGREDFKGKDVLIIDDISVYGGTFKGLSTLLKERNCGKLYLAVSHMTVQNLGKDPVTNYFDKVFTTNSKFDEYKILCEEEDYQNPIKNLEIIKLF